MSKPEDDNILSRWSRRKLAVEQELSGLDQDVDADLVVDEAGAQADEFEDMSEQEVLEHFGLPDPDLLNEGDDFKPFLQASIPDYLRKRALRRLWASNPVLANIDGLVDYGEDFTDAAMVPEILNTTYQVGKGMLKHILEMEKQDDEESETKDSEPDLDLTAESEDEVVTDEFPDDDLQAAQKLGDTGVSVNKTPVFEGENSGEETQIRPRRMRFET